MALQSNTFNYHQPGSNPGRGCGGKGPETSDIEIGAKCPSREYKRALIISNSRRMTELLPRPAKDDKLRVAALAESCHCGIHASVSQASHGTAWSQSNPSSGTLC